MIGSTPARRKSGARMQKSGWAKLLSSTRFGFGGDEQGAVVYVGRGGVEQS